MFENYFNSLNPHMTKKYVEVKVINLVDERQNLGNTRV